MAAAKVHAASARLSPLPFSPCCALPAVGPDLRTSEFRPKKPKTAKKTLPLQPRVQSGPTAVQPRPMTMAGSGGPLAAASPLVPVRLWVDGVPAGEVEATIN